MIRSMLCCAASEDILADAVVLSSDAKNVPSGAAVSSSFGGVATLLI
jgi:hypothetical protein